MYDQLPSKLKKRPHFCNWKKEQRNERMTKVPYRTNGKRANPTDLQSFTDFDAVCAVQDSYDRLYSYNDSCFTKPCLFRPWPHQIRAYNLLMAGNVRNIPGFLPKTSPEREQIKNYRC